METNLQAAETKHALRRGAVDYARSLYIWLSTALLILFWFPVICVVRLFDRDPLRARTGKAVQRLAVATTRINPLLKLRVQGLNLLEPGRSYIVVVNHQSLADVPLLARLPLDLKWVAKKSLFLSPVLGWMMRMAGDIPVDLKSTTRREDTLGRAKAYLGQGVSVMFFPEGRRSVDGCLHRFNRGAFDLAVQTGVPVLPVVVDGLWDFLPMHSWRFGKPRTIRLKVLPPVETRGFDRKDAGYLRERIRFTMLEQLAVWRECEPDEIDGILRSRKSSAGDSDSEALPSYP